MSITHPLKNRLIDEAGKSIDSVDEAGTNSLAVSGIVDVGNVTGTVTVAGTVDIGNEIDVNVTNTSINTVVTGSIAIVDKNGNYIEAHQDADGEYYLGSAVIQAVHQDPNNSSTTNLTSVNGYTFTGAATSTLGVAGLQWLLKTDQNAMVYIEQSQDGTNWDIVDSYIYYYTKGGFGETVQAIGAYWRIRVVLIGTTDTTFFRLSGILCPVVDPLPRSLDAQGRLVTATCIEDVETGANAEVDPLGSLKTVTPVRLVGASFSGTTKDTNFWTETVTGSGAITQAGGLTVSTGVTANSTAKYVSTRSSRKVTGATNQFRALARLTTATQANNIRRIGAYNDTDGYFFQVDGTSFGVGSRKAGVDTVVSSGSFNGNLGAIVVMNTSIQQLVINITESGARFFANNILLHTLGGNDALTNTLNLPVTMENINSGGNTTDNTFNVRFASILRLGELFTNPIYRFVNTNTTSILKYGAGTLQRIINCDNLGSITIYDNTSAAGTVIATIDTAKALGSIDMGVSFSTGLTLVTGGGAKVTVVYE